MNILYLPGAYYIGKTAGLKACVKAPHRVYLRSKVTTSLMELNLAIGELQRKGVVVGGIATCDTHLVQLLLEATAGKLATFNKADITLQTYQGSMFNHKVKLPNKEPYNIPVVVVPSPEHLMYSGEAKYLTTLFLSKLYDKQRWLDIPKLDWSEGLIDQSLVPFLTLATHPDAILMAIDIETSLEQWQLPTNGTTAITYKVDGKPVTAPLAGLTFEGNLRTPAGGKSKKRGSLCPVITLVGFTVILKAATGLVSKTLVIRMDSEQNRRWVAKLCATQVPKVMHNGRYDCSYLLRYNIPVNNWVFDTYGMMHSYLVELPRTLYFTAAFTVRNFPYWKDEAATNPLEYNAKDCHATAWACLALINQMPDWAKANYVSNFKQVFPAISCALEGFKQDTAENDKLIAKYEQSIVDDQAWWDTVIAKGFNVRSSPQVKQLMQSVLRTGIPTTSKPDLLSIVHKHPLWRLIVDRLISSRESLKAESTYLHIDTFAGRILYGLDPFGTTTGRYASHSSNFWCGTQIQNQPSYIKSVYVADDGWKIQALDNSQAESRTTAYIVGDEKLIDAVEHAKDFHTRNASLFFGIPEDELFRLKAGTPAEQTLFNKYRNKIGKRVNHGANYNMGANVLITTMTPLGIIDAKHTLGLPASYTLHQTATYLLQLFDLAYPRVRSREEGGYHAAIIHEVQTTSRLTNPDGWVRWTFLDPARSKQDLNALVAHKPQSWAVKIVNRAFFDAWHRLQIVENVIRMKAQVHDEIVFMVRPENEQYATKVVSDLMKRPNKFTAATSGLGKDGEMIIPNSPTPATVRWKHG